VPDDSEPFDARRAAHLLNRAGFGGTQQEIEDAVRLGPEKSVERLLDFPDAGAEEQSQDDVPDLSTIEGYPRNFQEIRQAVRGMTADERMAYRQQLMRANREAVAAIAAWWIGRMTWGPSPLQEKLTLFWHGHFTTSARDERSALLLWRQNDLLRRQAAGNFREFVRQISRDPAMLDYLNNQQNRKEHPNENYARELMELFTLGIGHYSENDIKEAARAFTGWGHEGDEFVFRRNQHDFGDKKFMRRSGDFDGDDVIDIILDQPACAPYIAGRMMRFFVSDDVDPAICQSLGQVIRQNDWDLRPALRVMLNSRAFHSPTAIGSQVKSPIQLTVGMMRALGVTPSGEGVLRNGLRQMGQIPLDPPNVKGWPGGRNWINTSTLFARYNTAVAMVAEAGLRLEAGVGPEQLVDQWLARLIQRPVSADKRKVLVEALGTSPTQQTAQKMVQLIVSMPEFQLC
jgi:uncharacterized protein (DUF1800 family)